MRGLYIGRFQPYHLGHEAVLQKISEEMDEIVIAIGSAQESHTMENPFTAGERTEMVCAALRGNDLMRRCYVIPVQDINRNSVWVSHLQSMVPRFDVVYSNNPLVVRLLSEAEVEVRKPPMYRRDLFSGTVIRNLMREGGDWKSLVPEPVAALIAKMGGMDRLASISQSDALHPSSCDEF
jgi:nicotinamide-nucleotide adenylyltransferase